MSEGAPPRHAPCRKNARHWLLCLRQARGRIVQENAGRGKGAAGRQRNAAGRAGCLAVPVAPRLSVPIAALQSCRGLPVRAVPLRLLLCHCTSYL